MKKSKRIALLALLLALTVILSMIPLRVSSATLALTLLPVFVLALTQDFLTGLLGGLVMGVTSLVLAFTFGAGTPTAPIFQNPLVSVLPRLFVPAAVFGVMKGLGALAERAAARKAKETELAEEGECTPREGQPDEEEGAPEETAERGKKRNIPRWAQALIDAAVGDIRRQECRRHARLAGIHVRDALRQFCHRDRGFPARHSADSVCRAQERRTQMNRFPLPHRGSFILPLYPPQ